jgi:hypothetical protein
MHWGGDLVKHVNTTCNNAKRVEENWVDNYESRLSFCAKICFDLKQGFKVVWKCLDKKKIVDIAEEISNITKIC